ncbi:OsmC family peroxiredoxin [Dyella solisilvae]|uniref:OsmC family peroxiredoxin n=1 Tax=Dyella solisilvae TaxID=1920168 RepID=A0A370KBE3_9GAMM|nr:OsmC family protein [Dyella solisilvae]RDI99966.1 OsmC family peroxiredoxin [Dyella solisilvae]
MSRTHQHQYRAEVTWTGNQGSGTRTYQGYSRAHEIRIAGKPVIEGSSDPMFRGDASRLNPEDMLVTALSTCHMLSYLHQAVLAGVVVTAYVDHAEGVMETDAHGGRFVEVVLRPVVTISADSDPAKATSAHEPAHHACFIANSVNFPVRCEPRIVVESA